MFEPRLDFLKRVRIQVKRMVKILVFKGSAIRVPRTVRDRIAECYSVDLARVIIRIAAG